MKVHNTWYNISSITVRKFFNIDTAPFCFKTSIMFCMALRKILYPFQDSDTFSHDKSQKWAAELTYCVKYYFQIIGKYRKNKYGRMHIFHNRSRAGKNLATKLWFLH